MMITNADSDPDFLLPSSPSHGIITNFTSSPSRSSNYNQNPRKKRSKMFRIEPGVVTANSRPLSRPKYAKKPDPNAPKITRPCTECGKKFWSWKALFGHMRCHPEREWRGINPPPNHRRPMSPAKQITDAGASVMTEEDHEIAACLLMLAGGGVVDGAIEVECGTSYQHVVVQDNDAVGVNSGLSCRFECSSCKKVFGSHQALGGHRASHRNVKGCFAITRSGDCSEVEDYSCSGEGDGVAKDNMEDHNKMVMALGLHKCSICLRIFSSGQALGGHKRCHWEKGDEPLLNQGLNAFAAKEACGLDLNMPAPVEDDSSSSHSSGLTLDLRLGLRRS